MRFFGRCLALGVALVGIGTQGCSKKDVDVPEFAPPGAEGEPPGLVVTPPVLPPHTKTPRPDSGGTITLPNAGEVHSVIVEGRTYVPIEATFSERSWQAIIGKAGFGGLDKNARDAAVKAELQDVIKQINPHARVIGADFVPSVGWMSAYIPLDAYTSLSSITGISRRLLVNPVITVPMSHVERDLKTDKDMGFAASTAASFSNLDDLVGLPRMGVNEFIEAASQDLGGYRPDGSHVRLGVVDTGLTFNHPAFRDASGASRVESMRDFTGEARIYFLPTAHFEVKPPAAPPAGATAAEALTLNAEFVASPKDSTLTPDPAALQKIDGETILVPADLRALLDAPNASGARFGVLDESAYGDNAVDLDHNGKTDDRFYAILVPGANGQADSVWLAVGGGKGDFRKSPRLTSFDNAHETMPSYAERFGLDIKPDTIHDANGADVPVTTAAVVGFDPGEHGSHVMGIAAARKMIANAPDDTNLRGVAPLARLMSGRICAKGGAGCRGTKAIAELSAAGAEVINMSIGSLGPDNDGYGVQETIIDRLSAQNGTVFVIAASNDGPGRNTVGSPAVARFSIAVAATASQKIIQAQYHYPGSGKSPASDPSAEDFMLYFSSRGPTAAGGMKPDIAAPGTWLSAITLNSVPGATSGLDVMWGTSMASPATAGAVTLLLDAAKVYNQGHPTAPLATDALTIRRVMLASARPFDVTTLDTKTQETKRGQYTWVDQGFGMVSLPRAWDMLKAEAAQRGDSAVSFKDGGAVHQVPLDYQVRVLRKNPNGLAYDGSQKAESVGDGDAPEAKYGRGLWLDAKARESLYRIQIARRLPSNVVGRPDVGELAMQLETTADEFELETTVHGSHLPWVRAGSLDEAGCAGDPPPMGAPLPRVLVVGEGATDQPADPKTGTIGSVAQSTSELNVCINRALIDQLPPGDHGAVVTAYRVVGKVREAVPSFVVPVYITIPHKTLAGPEGLHVSDTVASFGVSRHYIDVPKGTNIVKVSLSVPSANVSGTSVTGCSGVLLQALEGGNQAEPPEFKAEPSAAIAQNCTSQGGVAQTDWLTSTYTRTNPTAGIWDLHVFGLYSFSQSPYTLDVEFAKVTSTKMMLDGPPAALSTSFDVTVTDASYALALSQDLSTFTIRSFKQQVTAEVAQDKKVRVPNAAGAVGRSYDAGVSQVTIATGQSTGNDIDLEILECDEAALQTCASAGVSGTPTDVETVTFTPKAGKFYAAEVTGYSVKADGHFSLTEQISVKTPETGTLKMTQPEPKRFTFTTSFDADHSKLLNDDRFTSGQYTVEGAIDLKDEGGTVILSVPVRAKQQ
jgi:hypothetical protein